MTQEQFNIIQDKLRVLREERGLSVEVQKKNFKVDYTKKLLKFFEAQRDNNEYGMINSICGMFVTAINAGLVFKVSDEGLFKNCIKNESIATTDYVIRAIREFELVQEGILISSSLALLSYYLYYLGYNPYKCLLESIKELNTQTGSWNEEEGKWVKDKGAYTKEEAQSNLLTEYEGFIGKFVFYFEDTDYWVFEWHGVGEDENPEWIKIKKWYKADYESCKLETGE